MAYAEHRFGLNLCQINGVSKRVHLESVARQIKKRPKELDGPALPSLLSHLMGWWEELHATRTWHQSGPNPIGYCDIQAWNQLTYKMITPREVETIVMIDQAYLAEYAVQAKRERESK